jgi:lipoprotein-anchoring transpeptidase ErfK/SrfK
VNTLKSAALIVVLIGVLYGVYVALNKADPPVAAEALPASSEALMIEYSTPETTPVPPPPTMPSIPAPPTSPPLETDTSPAPMPPPRSVRGGTFQPGADPASPASPLLPSSPGAVTGAPSPAMSAPGGLQQSAYESPLAPAAGSMTPAGTPVEAPAGADVAEAASPAASDASGTTAALAVYALRRDMSEAAQNVSEGKYRAALAKLTPHYFVAELPAEDRQQLMAWLDPLAAKVIYSREHLLAPPHKIGRGETLFDIAQTYNVEYRLLQNINPEVREPDVLVAGTDLKIVPGPFHADVHLSSSELTLTVGELYAGRFPFTLGDQPPAPGDYKIIDKKSQQKTYIGFDGRVIPANDPSNPYGEWWISLGGEVAIHSSPLTPGAQTLGCISLSPQDAKDVYGILSIGSEVQIRQ